MYPLHYVTLHVYVCLHQPVEHWLNLPVQVRPSPARANPDGQEQKKLP